MHNMHPHTVFTAGGPNAAMLAGPEHVPRQPAIPGARVAAGGPQETELERRTRELQVRALAAVHAASRQLLAPFAQYLLFLSGARACVGAIC